MKVKTVEYPVSRGLQKALVALGAATYISTVGMNIHTLLRVYPAGPRISPFLVVALESIFLPLLLFCLAYFTGTAKTSRLWRSFEAVFLISITMLIGVFIGALFTFLPILTDSRNSAALLQFIPGLLITLGYLFLLTWYRRLRHEKTTIPAALQKLFIFIAAATYTINTGIILVNVMQQLPYNQNFSGSYAVMLGYMALPLLLFALAFYFASDKLQAINRIFEAAIFTLMGLLFYGLLNQVWYFVPQWLMASGGQQSDWQWYYIELGVFLITATTYVMVLWQRKRVKH